MDELYLSGSPASEDGLDPFGSASTRGPPLPSGSTSGTQSFLIPTSHSIPGDFGGPPTTSTLQTRFPERDDAERGASASSSSPPTRPCHPRLHQRAKSSGADGRPSTVNVSARSSAGSVVEGLDIPVKRPRNRWSDEETAQLVEGCNKVRLGLAKASLALPELTIWAPRPVGSGKLDGHLGGSEPYVRESLGRRPQGSVSSISACATLRSFSQ